MLYKRPKRFGVLFDLFLLGCGTALICLFWENNVLLTVLLAIVTVIGMIVWYTKSDFVFFAVAAVIGPTFESICIHFGAWQYSNPSCGSTICLNIPIWLWAWGMIVVLIKSMVESMTGYPDPPKDV